MVSRRKSSHFSAHSQPLIWATVTILEILSSLHLAEGPYVASVLHIMWSKLFLNLGLGALIIRHTSPLTTALVFVTSS